MAYEYLPDQYVSESKKKKEDWWKPTMDYWIRRAEGTNDVSVVRDHINYANGNINMDTYEYLLKPMIPIKNISSLLRDLPGELREVDFITYVREKYQGEYLQLPYKVYVKANNPEVTLKFNHELKSDIREYLEKELVNMMNSDGMDTNFQQNFKQADLEKFVKDKTQAFFDVLAKEAQDKLELINDETDFDTLRHQFFFDWFATESFYDYRYIDDEGNMIKDHIPPDEAFPVDNSTFYVEDYDAFMWRRKITWQQFLSKYQNKITKKERDYLEALHRANADVSSGTILAPWDIVGDRVITSYGRAYYNTFFKNNDFLDVTNNDRTIYENIVQFRVPRKINELKYKDQETNEIFTIQVEDDYKMDEEKGDITLLSKWIDETYTGVRVGDEHTGIYIEPKRDIVQRYHNGRLKLHFGGKRGIMEGIDINPLPKRLAVYQAMDRVLLLQIERAMAKMKDAILTVPKSSLNASDNDVREQYFYMLADGTYIYDDGQITADEISKAFRYVGHPGPDKYLRTIIDLRQLNKMEALEMANMNDSRRGDVSPYQGKSVNEQQIFRAKISSGLMIHVFHKSLEKSHQADLDVSKIAWLMGKRGAYFDRQNNRLIDVNVDGVVHCNTDYAIYVVDSKSEEEELAIMKDIAFSAAQNAEFGIAAEAVGMKNSSEGRIIIRELDEKAKARQTQMEQMAQQGRQAELAMTEESKQKDRDTTIYITQLKEEGDTLRKMMDLQHAILATPDNTLFSDAEKQQAKNAIDALKLQLEDRKINLQASEKAKDRQLKREDIKSKEKVARMNKN